MEFLKDTFGEKALTFSEFENAYKKRYAISIYNNIKKKGGKVNGV